MDDRDDKKDLILMEDGPSVHRSSAAKAWHDKRSLAKLEWPAQSPNLNPIENLWKNLMDAVQNRDRPKNVEEMATTLGEEYCKVSLEMLR